MGAVQHPECERARLWVSLALDGELSEIEQVSLRAHVGRCAACAAFEHDALALTMELRNAPPERPALPVALPRRRSTAMRVLQVGAAAAAIVLAAGLGSLAGSLSSKGAPTATTVARTAGGNLGARVDRGIVAMAPAQKLPASRIRPSVPI
jgi:predicted anti-sigma-YlaC factor YlaD